MKSNTILFRSSSIGHIMTDPKAKAEPKIDFENMSDEDFDKYMKKQQSKRKPKEKKEKKEVLSDSCKTHLIDVFINKHYGRKTDISNRYTVKGTEVEEDSMTLFSRIEKRPYFKNEDWLKNEYITGTPDIITSLDVEDMEVIDLKSSWDIFTFMRSKYKKELNKLYYWQLQAYMWLTGAQKSRLVYCLVNTPSHLIEDEKRKLWYKMGQPAMDSKHYVEGCNEIDRLCIYDDIAISERIHSTVVLRDNQAIEKMRIRTIDCNAWMQTNLFQVPERTDIEGV